MKSIARQLLKEFWIPMLIAISWTLLNFIKSNEKRDWLDFVNIGMPTFFLVSWITSQYFRVKKQENVSTTLSKIEDRVDKVLGDISSQARNMKLITDTQFFQTFDLCLDSFREAKEELSDRSRQFKRSGSVDMVQFELYRDNPFYQSKRFLNRLINYAVYTIKLNRQNDLEDRYTRTAYHVEELAGIITTFINRMNHNKIDCRTEKSKALIEEISNLLIRLKNEILPYSRYANQPYKGNQLNKVLDSHIKDLELFYK